MFFLLAFFLLLTILVKNKLMNHPTSYLCSVKYKVIKVQNDTNNSFATDRLSSIINKMSLSDKVQYKFIDDTITILVEELSIDRSKNTLSQLLSETLKNEDNFYNNNNFSSCFRCDRQLGTVNNYESILNETLSCEIKKNILTMRSNFFLVVCISFLLASLI